MARLPITKGKYSQVELNQVAFRRDGHVEAQAALSTAFNGKMCENGMLLAVDKAKNDGWGEITFAADSSLPIALVYTAEHMYDERANRLSDFAVGTEDDFYPRLGYLTVGDIFTTNCVDESAVNTATTLGTVYGASTGGYIAAYSTAIGGPKLSLVKIYTMPDGTPGAKFQVIA